MHKPQRFTAKLSEKEEYNDKFSKYIFELDHPNKMEFDPGQYVSINVNDHGDRRSYSICSNPDTHHKFELLIDHTPDGEGTKFLQALEFGAQADIMGPLGRFIVGEEAGVEEFAFVATGSGIAPFRSMILYLLQEKKETRPITLHWGLRHAKDLFWENDFQDLVETYPNFKFHPVLSREEGEWPLCKGRVTDCLSIHDLPTSCCYYLCGSTPMIEDTSKLLQERGVKAEYIHFEKFY